MNRGQRRLAFDRKPSAPPPTAEPQYCPALRGIEAVDFRQYFGYLIYTWLRSGNSFWMVPVDLIGDVLFCYAWDGMDWNYIRFDTSLIDSFY